jgi:hypothetical protein
MKFLTVLKIASCLLFILMNVSLFAQDNRGITYGCQDILINGNFL